MQVIQKREICYMPIQILLDKYNKQNSSYSENVITILYVIVNIKAVNVRCILVDISLFVF